MDEVLYEGMNKSAVCKIDTAINLCSMRSVADPAQTEYRSCPSIAEITSWYKISGLPLKKFFNTSGLLYKSLDLKSKLPTMTEDEMLALLASDGMLVKRPLVITDGLILTGFRENEWEKLGE